MNMGTSRGSARRFGWARPLLVCMTLLGTLMVPSCVAGTTVETYSTGAYGHNFEMSDDGRYIVVLSQGLIALFERGNPKPLWNITVRTETDHIAISPNGEYIAFSGNYQLRLLSRESSTPIWNKTFDSDEEYINDIDFSNDGSEMVVCTAIWGGTTKIYLFEGESPDPVWNYDVGSQHDPEAVISGDGEYILVQHGSRILYFNTDNATPVWENTLGGYVASMAISDNGDFAVVGTGVAQNKLYLFEKASSTPLWNYTTAGTVYSVDITGDGNYQVATSGSHVLYFDKASSKPLRNYTVVKAYGTSPGTAMSVDISDDGKLIAAEANNNDTLLYRADRDGYVWYDQPPAATYTIRLTSDGKYLAASTGEAVYVYSDFKFDDDDENDELPWILIAGLMLLLVIVVAVVMAQRRGLFAAKPKQKPKPKPKAAPAPAPARKEPKKDDDDIDLTHCIYCGSTRSLHKGHLIAPSKGGQKPVSACGTCNTSKGKKALMEWLRWVKKNKADQWEEIIAFNKGKRGEVPKKVQKIRDE